MRESIVIESMDGGGWSVQKVDKSQNPPKILLRKYVNTADVASLFTKMTTFDTGFISHRLLRLAKAADNNVWTIMVPGAVRAIIHYNSERAENDDRFVTKAAWMPPSMWIVTAPEGQTKKWRTKVCMVDMKSGMTSRYPTPNVYQDGNICWGHVVDTVPPMTFPRDLGKIVDYFFGSEFNTDLWSYSIPFFDVVKAMGKKKVVEEMNDDERMASLLAVLPDIDFNTSMEKFYKSAVHD
jgi:hypothetical protein